MMEVCKEMFHDRGYEIYEENDFFLKAVRADGIRIYLFLLQQDKFNIDIVKFYYRLLLSENVKHAILVYKNQMTPSVKKIVQGIHDMKIELFCSKSFNYNLTKHCLVPQHIRVSSKDHPEINKYPIIKRSDPICRYYGYEYGELIKIIRKDGTLYFRVVR